MSCIIGNNSELVCGLPCFATNREQTRFSIGSRVTAAALGSSAIAIGVLALCHIQGLSYLGVYGGAAMVASGSLLGLITLAMKCVNKQTEAVQPITLPYTQTITPPSSTSAADHNTTNPGTILPASAGAGILSPQVPVAPFAPASSDEKSKYDAEREHFYNATNERMEKQPVATFELPNSQAAGFEASAREAFNYFYRKMPAESPIQTFEGGEHVCVTTNQIPGILFKKTRGDGGA